MLAAACLLPWLCGGAPSANAQIKAAASKPRPPAQKTAKAAARRTESPASPVKQETPVIAVLHNLSGWKLRALLMPPDAPFASAFDDQFVRTNIVAGYLLPDGRSVVAGLPQAEAEMLNFSAEFRRAGVFPTFEESGLLLVLCDGVRIKAEFVGLDGTTGLSVLEASEPIKTLQNEKPATAPVVGQRLRLIAPTNANAAPPVAASLSKEAVTAGGDAGVVYLSMSEIVGHLKEVRRSPSGRTTGLTIHSDGGAPELTGGVALSEAGTLVGIIEQGSGREMRLLPAEAIRGAVARVQARRASVPQPWLGARGDAVAQAPLQYFTSRGWPQGAARAVVSRQRGVLLTSVAPGTPAAQAGLRPGDIVSRISELEVRGVEDMTLIIKELGGNSIANFTVLRAEHAPVKVPVRLSESPNPAHETARAEMRAVSVEIQTLDEEAGKLESESREALSNEQSALDEARLAEAELKMVDAAVRATAESQLLAAQQRAASARQKLANVQARLKDIHARNVRARLRLPEAEARLRQAEATRLNLPVKMLVPFGLKAIPLAGATRQPGLRAGLAVFSVLPDSAAAAAGVRPGDMIETINGQPVSFTDFNLMSLPEDASDISLEFRRDQQLISVILARRTPSK